MLSFPEDSRFYICNILSQSHENIVCQLHIHVFIVCAENCLVKLLLASYRDEESCTDGTYVLYIHITFTFIHIIIISINLNCGHGLFLTLVLVLLSVFNHR